MMYENIDYSKVLDELKGYKNVMQSLVRARNPFELRYFVIGKHIDRVQQYKQLVVEMEAKWRAIEEAIHKKKNDELDIQEKREKMAIEKNDVSKQRLAIEIEKIERDMEYDDLAKLGALKEVANFIHILETEYSELKGKSEEELLQHEMNYWEQRLAKQCQIDMLTQGKIDKGNLDVLMDLPKETQERILVIASHRLDEHKELLQKADKLFAIEAASSEVGNTAFLAPPAHVVLKHIKDAPDWYPGNKVVKTFPTEIMIATLHRPGDMEWVGEEQYIPAGKNYIKHWLECDREDIVGEYKNRLVMDAISLGCSHIFILDDDVVADNGTLQKLFAHNLDVVGAWYPKKVPVVESSSLIKDGETRIGVPLDSKGLIEIDSALAAGCTLYKTDVFKKLPYPWFNTTNKGTEDTWFTQKAMEIGIKSYLDTDIKCGHMDKQTRKIYEL